VCLRDVRLTPESRHSFEELGCSLSANKRRSRIGPFSLQATKIHLMRSLSRDQLHWQAGKLPQAVAELALRFAHDVDALNTRCERCHQHLGLEARQHLADA